MKTKEEGWTHSFSDRLSLTYDLNSKHSIGTNLRISTQNGSPTQSSKSTVMNAQNDVLDLTGSFIKRDTKNQQYQAAFNYNWLLDNKGSNFKLIADYLRYNNRAKRNNTYQYDITTENESSNYSFNDIDDKTDMLEVDAKFEFKFRKTDQLDFGLNYNLYKSSQLLKYQDLVNDKWVDDDDLSDNYKLEGENYAGYVSFSSTIGQKLMYKTGIRIQENQIKYNSIKIGEQNSKSYWGFYPSVNVMYGIDPQNGTMLNAGYQRTMNAIPYNVISPVVVYNNENSYTKGNLSIKPVSYNIFSLNFILRNDWAFYYMLLLGDGMVYYKTFIDEENPLLTYTVPVNGNKVYWHSLGVDKTFKVNKYWNLKIDQ